MTSDGGELWLPEPPREEGEARPRRTPQGGPGVPGAPGVPENGDPRHAPGQPQPEPGRQPFHQPAQPPYPGASQQPWTPQPPAQPPQAPQTPQPPQAPRFDPQTGRPLTPDARAAGVRPPQPPPQHGDPRLGQPGGGSPGHREQYAGPQDPAQGRDQYSDPRSGNRRPAAQPGRPEPYPGAAPSQGQRPDPRGAAPSHGRREMYADPRQPGQAPNQPPNQPPSRQPAQPPAQPPTQPPSHGRRPVDDNRALFRDEVPGRGAGSRTEPRNDPRADPRNDPRSNPRGAEPPSWQAQSEQPAPEPNEPPERDWRDDYEDAVSATRWDLSPIPSMAVAPRRANPSNLEALIPPRRGRVQGPATRHPGGPAGTGPGGRDGAPWEAGPRAGTATEARPAQRPATAEPSVGRASKLMALGTLASRMTGLVRQFLLVAAIGTAGIGNSYTIGLNLPNMLYILIIGGALNAVFVPQLVRSMHRDRDGGTAYASRLLTLILTGVLLLTVLTELFTPQLVDLFSNFKGANRQLAIDLGRMFMPQIFFLGLFVVLGQILNAKGRFGPMMWTPVLTNVVVIASTGAYWYLNHNKDLTPSTIPASDVRLLGLGVTLGIGVQALALLPYLRAAGIRLTLRFDWRGAGLGKAITLAKWTLLFVLVNQIGLAVVMRYASDVGNAGYEHWGVAAYNNAYMIWGLPQALITVSVITALLPRMSRAAVDNDLSSVREDISYGLRVTGVAIVPAAFAFLALGPQIAVVLFQHGGVDIDNAHIIGYMLSAFGLGLIPFSAQFLMLRGFYAFEDTRSPFTINIWISAANVALSSIVFYSLRGSDKERWAVVAMCFVYGVAYCIGLAITAQKLKRKLRGLDARRITQTYVRLIAASAVAGAAAFIVALYVNRMVGQSWLGSTVALAAGGTILASLFLVCSRLMRVEEVEQLLGSVRAKFGR